ncbi:MAG: hypothetical protein HWD58_10505 [Bacteroidota bacterium]|nr:MAG: hypothetical protein HWD58_10505 [Bacteroidota bacterium]
MTVDSSTRSIGINTSVPNSFYALTIGANGSKSGISIEDPVDNYALFSNKSGIWESVYLSKSNPLTNIPSLYYSGFSK